jgi:hypothetical protein
MNHDDPEERREELAEDEAPDLEVFASVRARELRFGIVPETRVWLDGESDFRGAHGSERRNLPEEVEPDVTYRDVEVRWGAWARIVDPPDPAEEA